MQFGNNCANNSWVIAQGKARCNLTVVCAIIPELHENVCDYLNHIVTIITEVPEVAFPSIVRHYLFYSFKRHCCSCQMLWFYFLLLYIAFIWLKVYRKSVLFNWGKPAWGCLYMYPLVVTSTVAKTWCSVDIDTSRWKWQANTSRDFINTI